MSSTPFKAIPPQTWLWLLQLLLCGAGAFLLWYATNWGVAISPDSAEYIAAARRLHGLSDLFKLPTQWAPGYPVLLKLSSLSGFEILAVTRVLQCLLLAGNLAAGMALLRHVYGKPGLLPLVGGVVLLCSFNLWQVNFYAWSEGPFLLCQQLSLLCLLHFLATPLAYRFWLGAALLAALALLFRYAGLAWIGAAGLLLLVQPAVNWQQRCRNAFGFGAVALLPFLLWLLANHFIRHESTNRQFVIHSLSAADWLALLGQVLAWFGLKQASLLALIELVLNVAVLVLAVRARFYSQPRLRLLLLASGCHGVVYILFIVFSRSFFDAYIPFDERIFVSAWLFTVLALLACAIELLGRPARRQWVAMLAIGLMVVSSTLRLAPQISAAHEQGVGYLSSYMSQLSKVEEVPQLAGRIVYSNAPDYLRMRTDLTIHDYPRKFTPTTLLANPDYSNELVTMQHSVQAGQALLVHYEGFEWRAYFPSAAELKTLGYESVLTGNGVHVLSFPVEQGGVKQ